MRRSTRRKLNNIGVALMVLGCVLMAAFALKTLIGGSPEPETSSTGEEAFTPFETNIIPDEPPDAAPSTEAPPDGGSGAHKVKIRIESDGAVRIGYRFQDGPEGFKNTDKSFSMTETVRGAGPFAQVGVQLQGATRASCTISVDGVEKSTSKTSGNSPIAVCGV